MSDPRLIADIRSAESCRLSAYQDSVGVWTIGWGHAGVAPGTVWTQQQADDQLQADLQIAALYAGHTQEWPFLDTSCRQNAVVELCFNMRSKWLLFVNCRTAIRAQNWQEAHDQLLSSLWASQVHAQRADRIANYLLLGEYQ
jgi:lysozyme